MDKIEKRALKTGVDENNNKLYYECEYCGSKVALNNKRCCYCRKRRPVNAYAMALDFNQKERESLQNGRQRTVVADRSVVGAPQSKYPCYPGLGNSEVGAACYGSPMLEQMGIPKYYSMDEYGRVFEAPVCYKPVNGGNPVPIAKPSRVIQTDSITVPVNFNNNQN